MAAKDESYEEVISQISSYMSKVGESCETLQSAAKDCVDNTDGDPAAAKSSENLSAAVAKIEAQMPALQQIITAMQEQLERIHRAAAKANS